MINKVVILSEVREMSNKRKDKERETRRRLSDKSTRVDPTRRKALGTVLRRLRHDVDLTQNELAPLVNQAYFSFISQIENGHSRIPSQDIRLWAKVLEVDARALAKECLRHYDPDLFCVIFPGEDPDKPEL